MSIMPFRGKCIHCGHDHDKILFRLPQPDRTAELTAEIESLRTALSDSNRKCEALERELADLRAMIFTNGNRSMTMEGRVFDASETGHIQDNNFDFDATLKVSGDFVDGEKVQYAQMIAGALNAHLDLQRKLGVAMEALVSAEMAMRAYAIDNPRWGWGDQIQDPNGVHRWLESFDEALAQLSEKEEGGK